MGPKLVPFFKTVSIYFVLYGSSESTSILFCIAKCLPIISLIFFVLLHGMSLSEYYRYSRLILIGLIFSVFGDAFLVWKTSYKNFECGLLMFAVAQVNYARAFGFWPFNPYAGAVFTALGLLIHSYLSPGICSKLACYLLAGFVCVCVFCFSIAHDLFLLVLLFCLCTYEAMWCQCVCMHVHVCMTVCVSL